MFGIMKKAMVVAAVAGVAAAAPAVASAEQWTTDGVNPYAGTATANGTLTLTAGGGTTTTCTVGATLNLTNPGGVAAGSVNAFLLGVPAGGTCVTNIPNCAVSAAATDLPWAITTNDDEVTISGIGFTNTYVDDGGDCPLDGVPVAADGALTGTMSGDTLTFTAAGPLTTTLGPATVSGSVTVADTNSNPISLF